MTAPSSEWGSGYVTDITYLPGYYRQQSPIHLNLACLIGGVAGIDIAPGAPLSYLELGCGHGFTALVLAACNPSWRVTGIDFNPAHIAAARALADESGITNAQFIEADLATLADSALVAAVPEADVVTQHGLWSWVGSAARAGIVRLIAARLRPGGLAHVSYNALPAWQAGIGMQRVLREAGLRLAGRSDRQAAAGLEIVQALIAAKAPLLAENAFVQGILKHAVDAQTSYLAHEYMNSTWQPCFHADVVGALREAKLDWVASAQLLENFSPLTLSDEARAVAERFDDPVMRELVKDVCLTRGLRHDVFVRGARHLTAAERDASLGEVMLGMTCSEEKFVWELDVPSGQAALGREFFGPIVAALARGPQRVGDLLALPGLQRQDNPGEVVGMLVGSDQAVPMLAAPIRPPEARAARFIQAAARSFVRPDNLISGIALATSGTGTPVPCPMLELFVAAKLQERGVPDPAAWAAALATGQPEGEQQRLHEFINRLLSERAPVWRALGVLPAREGEPNRPQRPIL